MPVRAIVRKARVARPRDRRPLQRALPSRAFRTASASSRKPSNAASPSSARRKAARLDLEADGTVSVYVGLAAVGRRLETVMAQIAADMVGVSQGRCASSMA
jgi:CO/xanthine dehydrogenase Mo-binding subunit